MRGKIESGDGICWLMVPRPISVKVVSGLDRHGIDLEGSNLVGYLVTGEILDC